MRDAFHPKSLLGLLTEVVLIGISVFLALLANQWSEAREHRERANASLRYFREEIVTNQKAIETRRQYHEALPDEIDSFLQSDAPKTFESFGPAVHFHGLEPVVFEHTAWDLALANQSLSYLDPQLAYAISRVYTRQQAFQTLQNAFLQSVIAPSTFASRDATGFATSIKEYLIDVNIYESDLLKLYAQLLPQIDAVAAPLR
ncbi:MAG: hypothetical protein M3N48_00035 [Verrucomicrobiota bacterium]|nr:hypothetical protein [Verrucomicrobiota bacterium]